MVLPMKTRFPTSFQFSSPYFTVGTIHLGSCFFVRSPDYTDPNKLNLLSSVHNARFQKPDDFSRYFSAYSTRLSYLCTVFLEQCDLSIRLYAIYNALFAQKCLFPIQILSQPSLTTLIYIDRLLLFVA